MSMVRPEIVAPAGTPAKLRTAFHFGADAAYLGLKHLSLRQYAGNFDLDQLEWAVGFAHERGRKVYVTANVLPFDQDLELLEKTVATVARIGADGIVVSDAAGVDITHRVAPELPVTLSTQFSVSNHAAANYWFSQGVQRIVLARELSLDQIQSIAKAASGQVEIFIHGAVCVAWSGRCFLSLYWAGADRDPRRGSCAQGCRWPYVNLEDRRRPGLGNPVTEDERGTYFFDAKDLWAMPVLDRLMAAGAAAWKIEGRTRSELYVGTTVDAYVQARDLILEHGSEAFRTRSQEFSDDLQRVTNRGFSTQFLTGAQHEISTYNPQGSYHDNDRRDEFVGKVVAAGPDGLEVELRNPLRPGTAVEICDRGMLRERAALDQLMLADGSFADPASPGTRLLVPGRFTAGPGALVRRA